MTKNKTFQFLLWGLVVVVFIIDIISIPRKTTLNQTRNELSRIEYKIQHVKSGNGSPVSTVASYDDEQDVAKSLHDAVAIGFGGIHSNSDWHKNRHQLNKVLSSKLADKLVKYGRDVNSGKFMFTKNKDVVISFGKANGQTVPVTILTTAQDKDQKEVKALIKVKYDLEGHRVIDSDFQPLSNDPMAVQQKEN